MRSANALGKGLNHHFYSCLLLASSEKFSTSYSSLVRVVSLVLDVSERGERPCTEPVELVLEEHDLLFLLLDHVDHLALVGNGHDTLFRVRGRVVAGSRLEVNDLLTLVHFHAQVTSLAFQLRVLALLLLDLLVELLLLRSVSLETVFRVLVELFNLAFKTFFVLLILLLVLALDDFLCLLCDTIKLNI